MSKWTWEKEQRLKARGGKILTPKTGFASALNQPQKPFKAKKKP